MDFNLPEKSKKSKTIMLNLEEKLKHIVAGQRIECHDDFGTIKYVGEVEGYQGVWLGIDWDNPQRGKHNGTVKGRHYFSARSPTSGSFVRPNKVNLGVNIIGSVSSRYGFIANENDQKSQELQMSNVQHMWNAPFVELVGFDEVIDKQSNYKDLTVLSARYQFISSLGKPKEFSNLCPNITELDLSKNLLYSWKELFQLCAEMGNLEWLKVSENIMEFPEDVSLVSTNLKVLVCGNMNLTWNNMKSIGQAFPNLIELIAPGNLIDHIKLDPTNEEFKSLQVLDLEGNFITSWDDINQVNHLPQLHTLNISSMKIPTVQINDPKGFPSLIKLLLKENLIDDWNSFQNLNKLPKLTHLSVANCSIYNKDCTPMVNQIITAMIERLEFLNGSDVREERKGAEIDYLKKFGAEWLELKSDPNKSRQFLDVHTRYLELINVYGEMEASELKLQAKTIKDSLLELNLNFNGQVIKKKVPPTMQVQRLVMLSKRLFKIANKVTLVYVDSEVELELEESKEINFYSIETDNTIIVKV